ncbi:helix-turn-helix domain-containing protein [Solirubrobacter phytolaccae]|uniref:helix-turn-helix domain-containing protein n=1 Tax=Solirubrobacter phytolaccae TaxID=1404360 RepID=UPI0022CDFBBD|nr:helix-turn-helix transcriptional regulator [Solirubrobacter phytolaccae]
MQGLLDSTETRSKGFATPGSALEQEFVRARLARAPRRRVSASVLETTTMFLPASLAILYEVDELGASRPVMALRGTTATFTATDDIAQRLSALEPVDPFSARRAQAMACTTLCADDVGGEEELRRSMFGRHLRKLDIGSPLHAYLWEDDRIVAGIVLLRASCEVPYRRQEAGLLSRIAPLLADALVLGRCSAGGQVPILPEERLTEREREVAQLVLCGASNAEIATRLGMSEPTVKTHLTRIYAKLGIRSRTELATQFQRPTSQLS